MTAPDSPSSPRIAAEPAALGFRLMAMIYDLLPLGALWFATAALVLLARGGAPVTPGSPAAYLEFALMLAVGFGYFGLSWRRGGQTLGMRPWRIRVTRDDGGTPTLQQALIRVLVAAAPLVLLLLAPVLGLRATSWTLLAVWACWFAVAVFDPRRRALHDIAAGTEVRRLD